MKTYSRQRGTRSDQDSSEADRRRRKKMRGGDFDGAMSDHRPRGHEGARPKVSGESESRHASIPRSVEDASSPTTVASSPAPADRILLSSDAQPSESDLSSLPCSRLASLRSCSSRENAWWMKTTRQSRSRSRTSRPMHRSSPDRRRSP